MRIGAMPWSCLDICLLYVTHFKCQTKKCVPSSMLDKKKCTFLYVNKWFKFINKNYLLPGMFNHMTIVVKYVCQYYDPCTLDMCQYTPVWIEIVSLVPLTCNAAQTVCAACI